MHETQKAYITAKAAYEAQLEIDRIFHEDLDARLAAGEITQDQMIELLVDRDMERSPLFKTLCEAKNAMMEQAEGLSLYEQALRVGMAIEELQAELVVAEKNESIHLAHRILVGSIKPNFTKLLDILEQREKK